MRRLFQSALPEGTNCSYKVQKHGRKHLFLVGLELASATGASSLRDLARANSRPSQRSSGWFVPLGGVTSWKLEPLRGQGSEWPGHGHWH